MEIYRGIAEKLVEIYDFDWRDNLKMKEACICSVEDIIAKGVNIFLIILLAIITGLWREIIIYFLTFTTLRFYAGGVHAKNYMQCIMVYVGIMFMSIAFAKCITPLNEMILLVVVLFSISISKILNGKYSAKQKKVGTKSDLFHKKTMMFHGIITSEMCGLFMLQMLLECRFIAQILIIQSCALVVQSIALGLDRKEVC